MFSRPLVVVVEVDDQGAEGQALLAAFGAAADDAVEAVEEAVEALGAQAVGVFGEAVDAFVGRAQGAGALATFEVLAEGLLRAMLRAFPDGVRQLLLIVAHVIDQGVGLRPDPVFTLIMRLPGARCDEGVAELGGIFRRASCRPESGQSLL